MREVWSPVRRAPHTDSVESVIAYRVPPEFFTPLAEFDGSLIVERTAGEVSARCHDEEANSLALNLMHDIVTGAKSVEEARAYYAKEFADYRRKEKANPRKRPSAAHRMPGTEPANRGSCVAYTAARPREMIATEDATPGPPRVCARPR
jgi:hypothetical protein